MFTNQKYVSFAWKNFKNFFDINECVSNRENYVSTFGEKGFTDNVSNNGKYFEKKSFTKMCFNKKMYFNYREVCFHFEINNLLM